MSEPFTPSEIVHLGGGRLHLAALELIIRIMNEHGRVQIIGANTDSPSSIMDLFGPFADTYIRAALKNE